MKLTKADRTYLREMYQEDEQSINQIERTISKTIFSLGAEGGLRKISCKEAIEILGRELWLSGMRRSAFHMTCVRTIDGGIHVHFDSSRFWKEI